MKTKTVDIAIIGHGSAGISAYKSALKHTKSIVVVEGGEYGTNCARSGCMPSKLLISAGNAAKAIRDASAFGISTNKTEIDGQKVLERIRSLRDQFVAHIVHHINDVPKTHKIKGFAQFLDNHTLQVGKNTKIIAKTIIIATGSKPRLLPNFSELGELGITNEDVFEWKQLPHSVAVFGTGVIGMELGQALERLGVRVAIFGRSGDVGSFSDPEIQEAANQLYHGEIDIFPGAKVHQMTRKGKKVHIHFTSMYGDEFKQNFEYVLSAIGRVPNVKSLHLQNTNLKLDSRGMPVYNSDSMQCGKSNIFIAGDANGEKSLLHEAVDEGIIAGRNAAHFPKTKKYPRRVPLGIVFTEPEMAFAGKTHRELPKNSFITGRADFCLNKRSQMLDKNRGKMNLYFDKKTKKLLGAEMIGPRTEHIAHILSWAIGFHATLDELLKMPFYHPTIEESLRSALNDAHSQM